MQQPQYIDLVTPSIIYTITSGSISIPSLFTSSVSYSVYDTNHIIGSTPSQSWTIVNNNSTLFYQTVQSGSVIPTLQTGSVVITGSITLTTGSNSVVLIASASNMTSSLFINGQPLIISSSYSVTSNNLIGLNASSASVVAATSQVVIFNTPMINTNYVIMLTGESPITTPSATGKTINGFTASFGLYTGTFDWIVLPSTQ